MEGTQQMQQK
jgi:U4/U6.U5 tri-snRNP-associated protein 2